MSLNDPVADMLTRIRNASMARKKSVQMINSKMKQEIARVLKDEGYIRSYLTQVHDYHPLLLIELAYAGDKSPVIRGLRRISKPGRRVYAPRAQLPRIMNNYGTLIVSTSNGVITGKQARRKNVGGELLCSVW